MCGLSFEEQQFLKSQVDRHSKSQVSSLGHHGNARHISKAHHYSLPRSDRNGAHRVERHTGLTASFCTPIPVWGSDFSHVASIYPPQGTYSPRSTPRDQRLCGNTKQNPVMTMLP